MRCCRLVGWKAPTNFELGKDQCNLYWTLHSENKANLRDLIAATGLVILLKLDSNHQLFSPCDLEIWWMTLKNHWACFLYYVKFCASFQIHWWIQTGVTVRKHSIRVKISDFFVWCDLEIWWMTLKNNRAPLLSNIKLCASFYFGVTVRKRLNWVLTSVTLTFDLWPWSFAWTSLLSLVITHENFMMIQGWEYSEKGVTDRQTDRQTDWTIHRAAWSQLKLCTFDRYLQFESSESHDC